MRRIHTLGGWCALLALGACAELVSRDPVTGRGAFNTVPEEEEIRIGTGLVSRLKEGCVKEGIPFDPDESASALVRGMGSRLASVSHRPHLPWEFHFIKVKDVNAFAAPGGKVFVLGGLFGNLVGTELELAAVLAHEVAHVTARHTAERQTREGFMPAVSKSARSQFYRASFSTRQEDEADRIGLLYMALAGYDPASAPRIWLRAHQKYGSDPGNYLYDHSLNAERARKVEALVPVARKYYRGPGQLNPDWKAILAGNDLIETTRSRDDVAAAIEAVADAYVEHSQTRTESKARERAAGKQAVLARIEVTNLRFAPTADGKAGVFVDVRNGAGGALGSVTLTIYYLDASGKKTLHSENVRTGPIPAGNSITTGFYRKTVTGSSRVAVAATDLIP